MLHIFSQGHRVNVGHAIRGIVEFRLRNLRREFVVADEIEIVALWIPCGTDGIEHFVSDAMNFAVGGAPNIDLRVAVSMNVHAKSEESAAW